MKKTERAKFFLEMAERMQDAAIEAAENMNVEKATAFYKLAAICADKASGVR